jgi:hypothetical protein
MLLIMSGRSDDNTLSYAGVLLVQAISLYKQKHRTCEPRQPTPPDGAAGRVAYQVICHMGTACRAEGPNEMVRCLGHCDQTMIQDVAAVWWRMKT